jgi:hypothetical protein
MPKTARQRAGRKFGRNPAATRESGRANRRCSDRSTADTAQSRTDTESEQ